jgi:hypothetical protein
MKFPRPQLGIGKLAFQRTTNAREIMKVENALNDMLDLSGQLKKETRRKNAEKQDYRR